MTPRFRELALLTHITFSVGWFGAVVSYVALAIAALVGHDDHIVRAAYLSMNLIGWFVIVPFSLAALLLKSGRKGRGRLRTVTSRR